MQGRLLRRALVASVAVAATQLAQIPAASASFNFRTCGQYPITVPPSTVIGTAVGTSANARVSVTNIFGNIGTELGLTNRSSTSQPSPVNVVEGRSAGGAGWQSSYWFKDGGTNRYYVFNQASGNSTSSNWGYSNQSPAIGWNPVYSDHYHPNGTFGSTPVPQSPCAGTGVSLDNGLPEIGVGTDGQLAAITNRYTLASKANQSWADWAFEQAFYMNRSVARGGDLRAYLTGTTNWKMMFRPYDSTTTQPAHVTGDSPGCTTTTYCDWKFMGLSRIVLVWNIFGKDIGVAFPMSDGVDIHFRLEKLAGYCTTPTNDLCGNLSLHKYFTHTGGPYSIGFNGTYSRQQDVRIGTPSELAAQGLGL